MDAFPTITPVYAAILGLWFLVLSFRVVQMRQSGRVSLGDGGNETLLRRMRGQANFAEYAPIGLLLIAFAEGLGAWDWLVNVLNLALLAGRVAHGWAFGFTDHNMRGRVWGMYATLAGVGGGALAILGVSLARAVGAG